MNTRQEFHKLIDEIQDEEMLKACLDLILYMKNRSTGKLWDSLTREEKDELILSYEESFDSENLVPHDEVKLQHRKWLEK